AGTGDPDLITLMPNRMFRNGEGRVFQDVTTAGGFGHLQKGHGVAFADLDNDGDQDVHENLGGAVSGDRYPDVLFENPGFSARWLKLRLEGRRANRSALGARVRVEMETGGVVRSIHRTVSTGGSFGANPLRLEVGLGAADRVREVEIRWPGSGFVQRVTGLLPDRAYRIREGDTNATPMSLKRLRFPKLTGHEGRAQESVAR
ncbi:MAG: CRTAC1 family protein, partial [Verrucomicrobiales bacterium]|nr:CRTAC1 family protein [Verrucomicrobiales bacterium]